MTRLCNNCNAHFQAARSHAQFCSDRCRKAQRRRHAAETARNEWYSPPAVVEAARRIMGGIDLDPASCEAANRIVQATTFYSVKQDGLKQPWFGRVWLNPPYSKLAPRFVHHFVEQFRAGAVDAAVLLLATHHMTTDWFTILAGQSPIACLPSKRLHFSGSTVRPAHGSVLLGVGVDAQGFAAAYASLGRIWTVAS